MNSLAEIESEEDLEKALSNPYPEDVDFGTKLQGDILVLGAGGKMGPTLVLRILQATKGLKVYAVSRFSDPLQEAKLKKFGATTIVGDLLNEETLNRLPDCPNVIYMAGMKFGATGQEDLMWAVNCYLPGRIVERFKSSRIVAFSTGNVYSLVPASSGGSKETDAPGPVGEYAQSCLGRERVLQDFSNRWATPICILRLNYAVEPRYGVLLDIAKRVYCGQSVPLEMGYVNVIWQGDANSVVFRALSLCSSPAEILNLTGEKVFSVRFLAEQFAQRFGCEAIFKGRESETALLNDASRCHELFGIPRKSIDAIIELTADWVQRKNPTLNKPTKFEVRDGKF